MPIALLIPTLLEANPKANSPDMTNYVLVCLAMLGLVLVLAYGFRRLLSGNLKRRAAARSIQVVDMLPMGGKQRLVVVRCYDRHFLIGVGDKEMNSIAELEAGSDELPSSSVLDFAGSDSPIHKRGFAGALDSVLAKWKRPSPIAAAPSPRPVAEAAPVSASKPAPTRRRVLKPKAMPQQVAPLSPAPKTKRPHAKWNNDEGILG